MSDVSPGPDWWQAADGRWYPPELKPSQHLIRQSTGATILVRPDDGQAGATQGDSEPGSAQPPAHEDVGGAIDSHTTLYLGRPAGTQNRPAAWAALAGAGVMLVGAFLPWATRSGLAGGPSGLGWRDAGGELGGGVYVVLLAVTVMTVSVRCMAGSYGLGWRLSLVGLSVTAMGITAVELVRIHRAIDEVTEVSRGQASLSYGPGLAVVAIGATVVLVAAAAYRVGSPD